VVENGSERSDKWATNHQGEKTADGRFLYIMLKKLRGWLSFLKWVIT